VATLPSRLVANWVLGCLDPYHRPIGPLANPPARGSRRPGQAGWHGPLPSPYGSISPTSPLSRSSIGPIGETSSVGGRYETGMSDRPTITKRIQTVGRQSDCQVAKCIWRRGARSVPSHPHQARLPTLPVRLAGKVGSRLPTANFPSSRFVGFGACPALRRDTWHRGCVAVDDMNFTAAALPPRRASRAIRQRKRQFGHAL
jgi:hypothetical protein